MSHRDGRSTASAGDRGDHRAQLLKVLPPHDQIGLCRAALRHYHSIPHVQREKYFADARRPRMDQERACKLLEARLHGLTSGELPDDFAEALPLLRKLSVNYLRHEWTDYDSRLNRASGDSERTRAAVEVFQWLGQLYAWLAPECDRRAYLRESDEVSSIIWGSGS